MRAFAMSALAVLLSGCISYSYVEPTTGERARVRFASDSQHMTRLRVYEGEDCAKEQSWMPLRAGNIHGNTPKRMGMPLWNFHEHGAREVYVAANQPVHGFMSAFWTMSIGPYSGFGSCGAPFTATFQSDKDYEVKFSWDGNKSCSVVVSEILARAADEYYRRQIAEFSNRVIPKNAACGKKYESAVSLF